MTTATFSSDAYGLTVSSDGPARDAWLNGLDASLAFDKSGIDELQAAVTLDPGFALAHATLARQQFSYGLQQEGQRSLHRAVAESQSVTPREKSQIKIAVAALQNEPQALAMATAHLVDWPLDVFVFSHIVGPFGLLAFSGRRNWRQQAVDLLQRQRAHWPGDDWWFLTTLAFSLAEIGKLDEAEAAAEQALQLRPNGNCAHTLSHVHFEQEAADTAYAFLNEWLREYGADSDMRHHLNWHIALLDLQEGKASRASMVHLYRDELAPAESAWRPQPLTVFSDNASVLWRCLLHGMELPGDFAERTCRYGKQYFPNAGFLFADLHTIIASVLVHRGDPHDQLYELLLQLPEQSDAHLMTGLCRGFSAFARQDYAGAADWLLPLLAESERLGGSNPQRRIVEETCFTACVRSGKTAAAVELLQKRLAERFCQYDQQALRQLLAAAR